MSERTQKLLRLAQALEILRERLLAGAADPTTAAALRHQLAGTITELSGLRQLVGASPPTEATQRLYLALEALELAAQGLPSSNVVASSRPATRRAQRFDQTARRLIARAAAVALLLEAVSPLAAAAAPGVNLDITTVAPATAASSLVAKSRTVTFNRVGERNDAHNRLNFATQALAAINGDTSAAATAALFSFHCQVNLGACIFGGGIPDKTKLAPKCWATSLSRPTRSPISTRRPNRRKCSTPHRDHPGGQPGQRGVRRRRR